MQTPKIEDRAAFEAKLVTALASGKWAHLFSNP